MFSVVTECTGFIFVKVDFVACPRNGSEVINRMRSTLRISRSCQTVGDDISIVGIAATADTFMSSVITPLEDLDASSSGDEDLVLPVPNCHTQNIVYSFDRSEPASVHDGPHHAFL